MLKVEIEKSERGVAFCALNCGDVFKYNKGYYLVVWDNDENEQKALKLSDEDDLQYTVIHFNDTLVEKMDGVLYIRQCK